MDFRAGNWLRGRRRAGSGPCRRPGAAGRASQSLSLSPSAANRVLRGVDLAFAQGEALGIVGESGPASRSRGSPRSACCRGRQSPASRAARWTRDPVGASERELAQVRGGRVGHDLPGPVSALNPVHRVGDAGRARRCALHRGSRGRRGDAPRRGGCSTSSASPTRRGGSTPIRTNCPAARTSAS